MEVKAISRCLGRICLILGLILLALCSIGAGRPVSAAESRAKQGSLGDAPVATAGQTSADLPARLTLRVYNYAHINPDLLYESEQIAQGIFANVGIAVSWQDCPISVTLVPAYPACQSEVGTSDLVLKILPRFMALKLPPMHGYEPLGFARPCPEGEPACDLTVFYYRIEALAGTGYRVDRILGYVIAHEVTHTLLGPGHSNEGIMRGMWSDHDLKQMSLGLGLDFTDEQAARLRSAALRRAEPPTFATNERTAP